MAVIVVLAVVFRFLGQSLIWYDEVASVVLAWLTYYGSALAVCNRGHLGFPGLFLSFPTHTEGGGLYHRRGGRHRFLCGDRLCRLVCHGYFRRRDPGQPHLV